MPNELEYIVDKAVVVCDNGAKPNFFNATNNQKVKISGCKVSIASDKAPLVNIPEFGICALTNKPCVPVPTDWQDTYKVKVKGEQTLLYKSKLPCSAGGMITFSTSGQVPLSQEDLDEMVEQHGEDPEESSWGWWDTAELIPVVGSVIGMVREANKGNWGMVALNAGFLVLDVLGFVSFGATTAVATTAKAGVKAGIKATAKKTIQTAMKTAKNATTKILGKQGIKTVAKALANKVNDIAEAYGKICIFACFPAGTPIHTESGIKNIEEIQIGDRVWAYDEDTEQVRLQRVTATFEREVDATLEIVLEGEVIETTAEHPFYTQEGWKDAADLTTTDRIKTQNHQWQRIKGHNFLYQKKKVYNFEVENWHTYFVGLWALLVHNARICLYQLAREGIGYAQRILRGIKFNKIMSKSLGDLEYAHEVWLKGMKNRVDTIMKNGKRVISRKATQLSDITEQTAKKYIDEVASYRGQEVQNIKRLDQGIKKISDDAEAILSIPKQNKPIPKNIQDYAGKKRVDIIEENITMDRLTNW